MTYSRKTFTNVHIAKQVDIHVGSTYGYKQVAILVNMVITDLDFKKLLDQIKPKIKDSTTNLT